MSRRLTHKELDALSRSLFKGTANGKESSDNVFLAAFRQKLNQARSSNRRMGSSIGEWSWKISPLTIAASALLAISLFAIKSGEEQYVSANERILWTLIDDEGAEISEEIILEAVLLGARGR